jgi:thiol:disulfide interchange protein
MKWFTPVLALVLAVSLRAAPEYPAQGPDIYDPAANGTDQIAAALQQAKAEGKRVLLDFGANWCPWCRKLHHTFATAPEVRDRLAQNYVVVMIDVNMRHGVKRNTDVNEKYGNPIHQGLPVLVVLDADGKQLITRETGALESGDHHDPAKVASFLDRWKAAKSP